MTRTGLDCTHVNVPAAHLAVPHPDVIMWYGTGSADIRWTAFDRSLFRSSVGVEIDQGFTGSPVANATVRDVENGAWKVPEAVNMHGWTAERPTIYCTRSTLISVYRAGWKGDVWLAWPGWNGGPLPNYPGISIVAVQNAFHGAYDTSVVIDEHWPFKPPAKVDAPPVTATVTGRVVTLSARRVDGAEHYSFGYYSATHPHMVSVARAPQPGEGHPVVVTGVPIPDASHGAIDSFYWVNNVAKFNGTTTL